MNETFEPVEFGNVHEGDRIRFVTVNNGIDDDDEVWRTGTVYRATSSTIFVECEANVLSRKAILRRNGWGMRCVGKASKSLTRRPYDVEYVQIVDRGTVVTALWIPDSEQARDPEYVLKHLLDGKHDNVEVVAMAQRFYKSDGATFSGWIVSSGSDDSEPIPNKPEAMQSLRQMITDYFIR